MLIRNEQLVALSDVAAGKFEADMLGHLTRCFPEECTALGDPKVREIIQYGITQSGAYGITAAREVCQYIDLMIVFGAKFDEDPKLPWAASILNGKHLKDSSTKIARLYQAAREQLPKRNP